VTHPLLHVLAGATRFALLLGLAAWLGLAAALCVQLPVLGRRAQPPPAELITTLVRRVEILLFTAMVLVVVGLGARLILDRAAPPTTLLVPIAGMVMARLLGGLAVSPSLRALRGRLGGDPTPPGAATDAERTAFARLDAARRVLLTLELCLALYALFALA
jgi:hypothetical protein